MESKANLRFARVSARKARLIADLVRGMDVPEAIETLAFTRRKSAPMVKKLIESAVANAEVKAENENVEINIDDLYVKTIFVDAGPTMGRFRPRAQGRATKILKKTSHITVVLAAR